MKKNIIQFIKFGIVGCSNTLISLAIYFVLIYFQVNYIIANTMGFIVSVLNAYFWNSKYVFIKTNQNSFKVIVKTFLVYGFSFILSTILLIILVDFFGIPQTVAPIINLMITIPLNFLLNKFWAYNEGDKQNDKP